MEKLTAQEEELMQVIWNLQEGNVKTFLDQLPDPKPPYTTLASTAKNLEKKRFISGRLFGNTYLYTRVISAEDYKRHQWAKIKGLTPGSLTGAWDLPCTWPLTGFFKENYVT